MSDYSWTEEGTLYSEKYNDVYFADGNGLEESTYVFLEGNDLKERMLSDKMTVGELGFGTGLNFLLTWNLWRQCKSNHRLVYISCEKHPLPPDLLDKAHAEFSSLADLSSQLRNKWPLTESGFRFIEFEQGNVALLLLLGDAVEMLKELEAKVDAWFLDGFSPKENPQMWSEEVFKQLAWHSHGETTFATYSAAGFVRRGLQSVGFEVEKKKGFAHKRHMTVGRYKGYVKERISISPWFQPNQERVPESVAVIGAGMAGLNCAYYLSKLGVKAKVFDRASGPASGASGNRKGMMYPLISKKPDRLGRFTEAGAHFSLNQFDELGLNYEKGLLEFAVNEKKQLRLQEGASRFRDNFVEYLAADAVSKKLGFESEYGAVLHHGAVSLSPLEYAEKLIESGDFETSYNNGIQKLQQGDKWEVFAEKGMEVFDAVVIASAFDSSSLVENINLRKSRGQLLYLSREDLNTIPLTAMNFINYLVPYEDGFVLGATFQVDDDCADVREEDNKSLIESAGKFFPGLIKPVNPEELHGRVSFRAVLKDFFPVVGFVPDWQDYEKYSELVYGKPVSSYPEAEYQSGLFTCCGLGSRGLTTAAYSASLLARQIVDGFSIMPVEHFQAVHPGRFKIGDYKRG